jgi:mono/diheme cytochrome c family protein
MGLILEPAPRRNREELFMEHCNRNRLRTNITGLAAAMCVTLFTASASADENVEAAGKVRFMENCAVCHGADGKGGGPFTTLLKSPPSDLTMLSKGAGGEFPFNRVYDAIDGRASVKGAHGSKDMPIWGGEWKGSSVAAETAVRGQILEMIIYLRSIQQ